MKQKTQEMTREAPITSVGAGARTFSVVWTTGAAVRRYDWKRDRYYDEVLVVSPESIRMDRLRSGAPVLDTHSRYSISSVIGVVESADIVGGQGVAEIRLSEREELAGIVKDVETKIIRNVSVGYKYHKVRMVPPEVEDGVWRYEAFDWEPDEISLVPIGADVGAGTRAEARLNDCEFIDMSMPSNGERKGFELDEKTTAVPAQAVEKTDDSAVRNAAESARNEERLRSQEINDIFSKARSAADLGEDMLTRAIAEGVSVSEFRKQVIDKIAEKKQVVSNVRVETVRDEADNVRDGMAAAIVYRANPKGNAPDNARQYLGYSLREMARAAIERQGVDTRGLDVMTVVSLALGKGDGQGGTRGMMGTSDFAVALGSVVNRSLRAGYEAAPQTFKTWARQGSLPDFRAATRVSAAGNLTLEKVNEHGEFKRGKITDQGETIQLATFGKVVAITRQVVINDDIGMIARIPQMFGRAAAEFESDTVYALLMANPAMADGTAVFHSSRGNLAASGGGIDVATLSTARAAMRTQKDGSGTNQPLNLSPSFLLVGATRETAAEQFLAAAIVAAKATDTNPFKGRLTPVVEPRISGSPEPWFVVADPGQIDTVEYAYLDGQSGLYTEQRDGFDVDGIEIKGRLDFAAKVIDYRGLYKNPGA